MSDLPPIPPSGSPPPPPPPGPAGSVPPPPPPSSAGSVPPPPGPAGSVPPAPPRQSAMPPPPPAFGAGAIPPAPPTHTPIQTPIPGHVQPPPGYSPYGGALAGAGTIRSTSGLRTATIVLFWLASAAAVVLGVVAYQRGNVLDDFLQGAASLSDVDAADGRVGGLALLMIALQIAAAITLAIWSNRTVSNAKVRGADASPGLAAGGWFIPIGNWWVPWGQLRRAAGRFGQPPSALTTWQVLFVAQAVVSVIARVMGNIEDLSRSEGADAVSKLHNQGVLFAATGVILAIASVLAARAMKGVDDLTTPA